MISSNDLKPGLTIQQDGELYIVLDASQNKTARSAMVVKAKVRNLRSGANVELSWGGGEKIQPAQIDKKEMQYLYDADDALVFMDNETYEQIEIPAANLEWERKFMKPNDNVNISMFEGEVLGVGHHAVLLRGGGYCIRHGARVIWIFGEVLPRSAADGYPVNVAGGGVPARRAR